MCRLVLEETGLLPHANAGALDRDELAELRPVSASQGMMLETLNGDLDCHRHAPDKSPERRLATLEAAGELAIPFTTGILVGIGESRQDRLDALRAIAASHARHGHVQEVIVQNFLPKPLTVMRNAPACPSDDYLWTIAAARLMLPPDVHLQAPPNLSDDFGALLDAGIDDWGGVSPVTADHVNPERPWPDLDRLRDVTEDRGFVLAPRLTIYPERALAPERWLDPALRFAVLDRSDAEGLGRDDPGAHFPERISGTRDAGDGAEVILVGDSSTAWYSGAPVSPPPLVPWPHRGHRRRRRRGPRRRARRAGGRRRRDRHAVRGPRPRGLRRSPSWPTSCAPATVGDTVTWVHNRNINYTNVCTFKCRFCGFSKGPLSLNLRGTPYLLTLEDIAGRVAEAWGRGRHRGDAAGRHPPELRRRLLHRRHPGGEGRGPGHPRPRVHRARGHRGRPAPRRAAGHVPPAASRRRARQPARHRRRDPRRRDPGHAVPGQGRHGSSGSTPTRRPTASACAPTSRSCSAPSRSRCTGPGTLSALGTCSGAPAGSPSSCRCRSCTWRRRSTSSARPAAGRRSARRVLMHAVGRIAYHGTIDNIQASWVKIGVEGARQLLQAGVNDLGGTLMDENISRAAGAEHGQGMEPEDFAALVAPLGRPLAQRTTLYGAAVEGVPVP